MLTEIPWNENPDSHSNAGELPAPPTPAISRRGVLAAAGAGLGVVVVSVVGQTLTPLEPLGLLAPRQPSRGPLGLPVTKTAEEAQVPASCAADWRLEVDRTAAVRAEPGRGRGSCATVEERAAVPRQRGLERRPPAGGGSACSTWSSGPAARESSVSGCSRWSRAGRSTSRVVEGAQLDQALLATHLNGERLSLDHGYPLRLIVPNRAGLFDTKWLTRSRCCR